MPPYVVYAIFFNSRSFRILILFVAWIYPFTSLPSANQSVYRVSGCLSDNIQIKTVLTQQHIDRRYGGAFPNTKRTSQSNTNSLNMLRHSRKSDFLSPHSVSTAMNVITSSLSVFEDTIWSFHLYFILWM